MQWLKTRWLLFRIWQQECIMSNARVWDEFDTIIECTEEIDRLYEELVAVTVKPVDA